MNTAKSIYLELFGVKKRLSDVERISFSLDAQMQFERQLSLSNSHRQVLLYDFGHIIFYTWPEKKIMTVDVLTNMPEMSNNALKYAILKIFKPSQHTYYDLGRITGDSYQ